jgi:branched-chain amino acid transport system ATP-binding protein
LIAQTQKDKAILSVRQVTIKFGGIIGLLKVSFDVEEGFIVGLIGPNGSGKTTLFNCLSCLYRPGEGEVLFKGRPIISKAAYHMAEIGIGRTFQNLALFSTLTVLQNVMIGVHSRSRGGFLSNSLRLPLVSREERKIREKAMELLSLMELEPVADHPAVGLPFGTLKRVELARALASEPKLLLLDEPAGGLNHQEVKDLGKLIRNIRDHRGVTILLVEHHMNLVMQVSDKVVVLNFGQKIAEGTPEEIQRNPEVIQAYLGDGHK